MNPRTPFVLPRFSALRWTFNGASGGRAKMPLLALAAWMTFGTASHGQPWTRLWSTAGTPVIAQAAAASASPGDAGVEVKAQLVEAPSPPLKGRTVAIFVENRAGVRFNKEVPALEDMVASQLSGPDFMIISREDVLQAKKVYPTEAEPGNLRSLRNTTEAARATAIGAAGAAEAVAAKSVTEATFERAPDQNVAPNRNSLGTTTDRKLNDESTSLRLAQAMGAENLLVVNIGSFGKNKTTFNSPEQKIKGTSTAYVLRGTYKITEGYRGGSLGGGTFKASKSISQSDSVESEPDDLVNELLEDAARQVVEGMTEKVGRIPRAAEAAKVQVTIASYAKDLAGNEVTLPDIHLTEGKVERNDTSFPALVSATVKIDGFATGVTPVTLRLAPGPHRLQLERPGFEPVELNFLAQDGVTLAPTMWMTAAGFQRWKAVRDFLNSLDTKRELTKAQVKVLEGHAQMLRQTGYLVDTRKNVNVKEDIKVDTKQAPQQNIYPGGFWNFWRGR